MFSTVSKRFSCALVLLLCSVGLATAFFQGSSTCGIQIHRASGKVLWCETQTSGSIIDMTSNLTIYVASMNNTSDRVAIFTHTSTSGMMTGGTTTNAVPSLETTSGRIMISISSSSSAGFPMPPSTSNNGFQILSGSIQDVTTWTTMYTNTSATELLLSQTWVSGVFLFATTIGNSLLPAKNVSYKAFIPNNNNGFSFVEIFPYSTTLQTSVKTWVMDGSARLCLSITDDQSYIVCRSLTNTSTELVIHSDSNSVTFPVLVSDDNGRIFWGEVNGTTSWRVWAAHSDKTDVPTVIDRTTNTTYVDITGAFSSAIAFGYDSYNKLVYWTEQIPLDTANNTFAVYGWDGTSNSVVTYFTADNSLNTWGQMCAYNGKMLLTTAASTGGTLVIPTANTTHNLYQTAPSSSTPDSTLLLTHIFQDTASSLSLVCDVKTGWAVAAFFDIAGQIGSAVAALRIDNTTSVPVHFSTDVNITLGYSVTLTDGVVGYTLGNTMLGIYDLFFYTLPVDSEVVGAPSNSPASNDSPASSSPNANPNTNTPVKVPSGKVSFANQIVPLIYLASFAYLFF